MSDHTAKHEKGLKVYASPWRCKKRTVCTINAVRKEKIVRGHGPNEGMERILSRQRQWGDWSGNRHNKKGGKRVAGTPSMWREGLLGRTHRWETWIESIVET